MPPIEIISLLILSAALVFAVGFVVGCQYERLILRRRRENLRSPKAYVAPSQPTYARPTRSSDRTLRPRINKSDESSP